MTTPATEITYISHYTHDRLVPPGGTCQITARPQLGVWRPVRLYVERALAPSFVICDVRIGNRSQFVNCQEIAASQFMHGRGKDLGDDFDGESIFVSMDFLMVVSNIGPVDLPFRATWRCERDRKAEVAHNAGPQGWDSCADFIRRRRDTPDAPSEIGHIPEARSIERWRREIPLGWDPFGDDE